MVSKQAIHPISRVAMLGGAEVGIRVRGESDRRVTENLGDDFERHALGEQERGSSMAQIVKARWR